MNIDETERGNSAYSNEEGSAVIFIELDDAVCQPSPDVSNFKFLQSAFTPQNYPMWDISTIELTKEKLRDHIAYKLGGWHSDKNTIGVNVTDDSYVIDAIDIVESVVDHAINQAHSNDYNPLRTQGMVSSGIRDSAAALNYELTDRLHTDCCELFENDFDPSSIS